MRPLKHSVITHIYAALHRLYQVAGNRDSHAVVITSCLVCISDSREVKLWCQDHGQEPKGVQILSQCVG